MCSSTRGPAMAPSLVTWPHQEQHAPGQLGKAHQPAADSRTWDTDRGGRGHVGQVHGLDGVHHAHLGLQLVQPLGHHLHVVFRQHVEAGLLGPQPCLPAASPGGPIPRRTRTAPAAPAGPYWPTPGEQGGFPDARVAAHQQHGPLHRAASQHPVQLAHAGGQPLAFLAGTWSTRRAWAPAPGSRLSFLTGASSGAACSLILFQLPHSGTCPATGWSRIRTARTHSGFWSWPWPHSLPCRAWYIPLIITYPDRTCHRARKPL